MTTLIESTTPSTALFGIEVSLLRGVETLRWTIDSLQKFCEITAASSIVQCNSNLENPLLKIVIKVNLTMPPEQVIQELLSIEYDFEGNIKVMETMRCFLMAYDQIVCLSPSITLPHPQMLDHTSWLYCSCEVWRCYRHPILDLTLDRILSGRDVGPMEFFGQGKSVINKQSMLSP